MLQAAMWKGSRQSLPPRLLRESFWSEAVGETGGVPSTNDASQVVRRKCRTPARGSMGRNSIGLFRNRTKPHDSAWGSRSALTIVGDIGRGEYPPTIAMFGLMLPF